MFQKDASRKSRLDACRLGTTNVGDGGDDRRLMLLSESNAGETLISSLKQSTKAKILLGNLFPKTSRFHSRCYI